MANEKQFLFKGKTIEQLKAGTLEEFAALIDSTRRRKMKRGFTTQENIFLENVRSGKKNIKTHCRDMLVLPEMIGMTIGVYTGREFLEVRLVDEMVGMRLGELAPTRKIGVVHAGSAAKKTDVRK
ncbi:MAG: ribosomal protein S19 family protein [Nanoarchaeales archaeon]|nr:ribosomal protein S19 family protein [Nanoarchaeales archaeon]